MASSSFGHGRPCARARLQRAFRRSWRAILSYTKYRPTQRGKQRREAAGILRPTCRKRLVRPEPHATDDAPLRSAEELLEDSGEAPRRDAGVYFTDDGGT